MHRRRQGSSSNTAGAGHQHISQPPIPTPSPPSTQYYTHCNTHKPLPKKHIEKMSRVRTSSITDERIIPRFARAELTLGNILGEGGFSLVLEVKRIEVDEVFNLTKEQTEVRQEVARSASVDDGYPKYAIKMLRDDLVDEEHSKGVIDLAVEARLLRMLTHPNIVTMR